MIRRWTRIRQWARANVRDALLVASVLAAAGVPIAACSIFTTYDDLSGGPPKGPGPGSCNADLTKDPNNCGSCGHTCQGSTCTESTCDPLLVIGGESDPAQIVAQNGYLAWISSGEVAQDHQALRTCEAVNCAATARTLVDFPNTELPALIALGPDGRVLLTHQSDADSSVSLVRFQAGANERAVLGSGAGAAGQATSDTERIYVGITGAGLFACGDRNAGCGGYTTGWTKLAPASAGPFANVAVTPTRIYWVTGGENAALRSCPRDGCAGGSFVEEANALNGPTPFLGEETLLPVAPALAVDSEGGISFANYTTGKVLRCPPAGCGEKPTVMANQRPDDNPRGVVADGQRLLWANEANIDIVECAITGCNFQPKEITVLNGPGELALDRGEIYVTSIDDHAIYRVVP